MFDFLIGEFVRKVLWEIFSCGCVDLIKKKFKLKKEKCEIKGKKKKKCEKKLFRLKFDEFNED